MEILVTGTSGFLGSNFVRSALFERGMKVHGVVRPSTALPSEIEAHPNFFAVLNDSASLRRTFVSNHIEAVVHLATEYGRDGMPVAKVLDANLALPIMILDFCAEFGIKSFVNIDSYFNKPHGTYSYLSNYALSKKSLSNWFKYYCDRDVQIINVVLEHVYGPEDSRRKFVPHMIDEIAIKQSSHVNVTEGFQSRDFIYVDDVVSALHILLESSARITTEVSTGIIDVPVGTGLLISIREFCTLLLELSKSSSQLIFGAIEMRPDEIMSSHADTSLLNSLGWVPKVDLETGLTLAIENVRSTRS